MLSMPARLKAGNPARGSDHKTALRLRHLAASALEQGAGHQGAHTRHTLRSLGGLLAQELGVQRRLVEQLVQLGYSLLPAERWRLGLRGGLQATQLGITQVRRFALSKQRIYVVNSVQIDIFVGG